MDKWICIEETNEYPDDFEAVHVVIEVKPFLEDSYRYISTASYCSAVGGWSYVAGDKAPCFVPDKVTHWCHTLGMPESVEEKKQRIEKERKDKLVKESMQAIKNYCFSFDGCDGCVFNINNRCSLTDGNVMNPSEWEV